MKPGVKLRVLVACERSGVIREEFRRLGHDAWSCDLEPAEDGSDYHVECDVQELLANPCVPGWDIVIIHPECRYLSNSGVLRLYRDGKKVNGRDGRRWLRMVKAAKFFRWCLGIRASIGVCVENPVMHGHARRIVGVRHTQTIQPWQFGEDASKRTCLWLTGRLKKLEPTVVLKKKRYANQTPSGQNRLGPSLTRAMDRARTYKGIARAMAEQWGGRCGGQHGAR